MHFKTSAIIHEKQKSPLQKDRKVQLQRTDYPRCHLYLKPHSFHSARLKKALPVTWERRPPKKAALISPFTPAANQFPPPTDSLHRASDATPLIQQFLSYALLNSAHLFLGGTAPGASTLSEQKSCFNLTIHSINCQPFDNICSPSTLYTCSPSCTIVGKKLEKR